MIRMPRIVPAALVTVGLVALLGQGGPDPSAELASGQLIERHAAAALDATNRLADAVESALEAGRVAAAAVLTGDGSPAPLIDAAAARATEAEDRVLDARRAVARLRSALDAAGVTSDVPQPVAAGELASLGGQLAAATDAAEAFVERRSLATGVPGRLEEAIASLDAGRLPEAREHVAAAREAHGTVSAWEMDLATLPVWVETMDAMISAVEDLVDAVEAGDTVRVREAVRDFAALGPEGARADRALRIAVGEGGSAILAAPLERLAAVMGGVEETRAVLRDLAAPSR